MGAADGRAGRPDRHELEQGLDHRGQRRQPLRVLGHRAGKHGDEFDNTSRDTAEGYVKTIERALKRGWHKDNVGSHVVRNNVISHCEQTGIVGSLGAAFSVITGNVVHDIHVRALFTGAEMAGIKLHAAIDVEISRQPHDPQSGGWARLDRPGDPRSGNLFDDNRARTSSPR